MPTDQPIDPCFDDTDQSLYSGLAEDSVHDRKALMAAVLERSQEQNDWNEARREWDLIYVYQQPGHCVCGHYIVDRCVIRNRLTNQQLIVGNVCVNNFNTAKLRVTKKVFQSLKKLYEGHKTFAVCTDLIDLARHNHILDSETAAEYVASSYGLGSRAQCNTASAQFNYSSYHLRVDINGLLALSYKPGKPQCNCGLDARIRLNMMTGVLFWTCPFVGTKHDCKFIENAELPFKA